MARHFRREAALPIAAWAHGDGTHRPGQGALAGIGPVVVVGRAHGRARVALEVRRDATALVRPNGGSSHGLHPDSPDGLDGSSRPRDLLGSRTLNLHHRGGEGREGSVYLVVDEPPLLEEGMDPHNRPDIPSEMAAAGSDGEVGRGTLAVHLDHKVAVAHELAGRLAAAALPEKLWKGPALDIMHLLLPVPGGVGREDYVRGRRHRCRRRHHLGDVRQAHLKMTGGG